MIKTKDYIQVVCKTPKEVLKALTSYAWYSHTREWVNGEQILFFKAE